MFGELRMLLGRSLEYFVDMFNERAGWRSRNDQVAHKNQFNMDTAKEPLMKPS
jgi:hypothetical protein